jgi:hypothetical protein
VPGLPMNVVPAAYWKGERLPICFRTVTAGRTEPDIPGPADAHTSFYDAKEQQLYVNVGDADPRRAGVVEAVVRPVGFRTWGPPNFLTIRKFTVRRAGWRSIDVGGGVDTIVEDCEVYDGKSGIAIGSAVRPIVRRCLVHDVSERAMDIGSREGLFYDNVVYAFAQNWERKDDCYFGTAFICFGGEFARLFHNVVLQPLGHVNPNGRGTGFWPDVFGPGDAWVGNAVFHCSSGFYIEAPMFANAVQWNAVTKCAGGIVLSVNAANLVAENYLDVNGSALTLQGTEAQFPDVAHSLFSRNWVKRASTAVHLQKERGGEPGKERQTRNYVQAGVYGPGQARRIGAMHYGALKEFQERTGQDTLGREDEIDPAQVGLVWMRVDGLDDSREVFPMIGNPGCDRQGWLLDDGPFFWRRGDENGADVLPADWVEVAGAGGQARRPAHASSAVAVWAEQGPVAGTPVEGPYLEVTSLPKGEVGAAGLGWWSPSLPCAGGSTIDLELWMNLEHVRPRRPDGGALVCVEWSSWTGQRKSRSYAVGTGGPESPLYPELSSGTAGWTRLKHALVAPQAARRFALFLGARSCTGSVGFDEIRVLAARPGAGGAAEPRAGPVTGRPLVDPATLRFVEVPLSGVFNRPRRDDVPDDGYGWLDLGGGYDLSGFAAGRKNYYGVPFTVADRCLMLKSPARPRCVLPDRTNVSVNVTADVWPIADYWMGGAAP